MIRFMLTALTVLIAVIVTPNALENPAINSADLILVAAPIVVIWIGVRRRRGDAPRQPWIQTIPEDHPDSLGSLDLRDRGLPPIPAGGGAPPSAPPAPPAVPSTH